MPATATRVMLIEDEPKLLTLLGDYLRAASYEVEAICDGSEVVAAVKARPPDLVLLDLTLPSLDGLEVCRELRSFTKVPIIIITARIDEVDRLIGLELGADDYICKPFSPREVIARARAILRRAGQGPAPLAAAGLVIDEAQYHAQFKGKSLDLTPVEFKLLKTFVDSPGRVFSRQQLLDRLYADHRIVTDRTVDSHVKNLRRKLQSASPEQDMVHSVYGVGYKLDL